MTVTRDRWDYLGRVREQRLEQEARDRRQAAIRAAARVSVQVATAGGVVRELLFDEPPTLAELIEMAGGNAAVLSVERLRRKPRPEAPAEHFAAG